MAHGSTHGRPGRTARLILLLATLLGLAAMHTLGHHGPHLTLGHHGSHPGVMAEEAPAVPAGDSMSAAGTCVGCGAVLTAPMYGGNGMDGWDICMAVLVAFAVLLLAAALLRARRTVAAAHQAGRSASVRPRGPPGGRVGLSLVTVSVLRL